MRSKYWQHFGFPADNNFKIITRHKIICKICNAIIAYNKNTSNLRTHLISRHAEILMQIEVQNFNNKKPKFQHSDEDGNKEEQEEREQHDIVNEDFDYYEDQLNDDNDDEDDDHGVEQNIVAEYKNFMLPNADNDFDENYVDDDLPQPKKSKQETSLDFNYSMYGIEKEQEQKQLHEQQEEEEGEEHEQNLVHKELELHSKGEEEEENEKIFEENEIEKLEKNQISIAFIKLLINDLLPMCTLNTVNYHNLIKILNGNIMVKPNMLQIKNSIITKYYEIMHKNKKLIQKLQNQQITHNNNHCFSLCLEFYGNDTNTLDIYYNYMSQEEEEEKDEKNDEKEGEHQVNNGPLSYQLHSILYETRHYICLENLKKILIDFDLSQCVAIVLANSNYCYNNFSEEDKDAFMNNLRAQYPQIPIIYSVEHVVNKILHNIFQLNLLKNAICKLFAHIHNNHQHKHNNKKVSKKNYTVDLF